jgi:Family of unknown function (DUF6498)
MKPSAPHSEATSMAPSSRNLILANLFTLTLALIFAWEVGWLLWSYWVQSVVIGWYARKRMLALARFSTQGIAFNDAPVPENQSGKRSIATFFTLHYGTFHIFYFAFLWSAQRIASGWDGLLLLAGGFSFVFSQRETYAAQHASDLRGKPNLGRLMFTPYLRVVPMHLMVIFVNTLGEGIVMLIVFTLLKTASDLGLDALDRQMAAKSAENTAKKQQKRR